MNNLALVDFNDLFVIAVGISMAYIVISRKDDKHNNESKEMDKSFFRFLSIITDKCQTFVLNIKTKKVQNEESVITKIQYYLNSKKLNEQTVGALDLVCKKAQEVKDKINDLESWFKEKLFKFTKTDYLNVISYDCSLFGLFILFVGALGGNAESNYCGLIEWMLLYVCVGAIHCLLFERIIIENRYLLWSRPSLLFHGIAACVFLVIGIKHNNMSLLHISSNCLIFCSVGACFIGFISYLIVTIIANLFFLIIMLVRIMFLKVRKNVIQQQDDIKRYQEELDKIDNIIKREELGGKISITGGDRIVTTA